MNGHGGTQLTAQDFKDLSLGRALNSTGDLHAWVNVCYEAAEAARESGEQRRAHALEVVGHICALSWRLDNPEEPFGIMFQTEATRSASIEDIASTDVRALADAINDIPHPILRARLADAAWVKVRHFPSAQTAAQDYLDEFDR